MTDDTIIILFIAGIVGFLCADILTDFGSED